MSNGSGELHLLRVGLLTLSQKIRTIELDGKTVKLQIVCVSEADTMGAPSLTAYIQFSGIPLAKSVSEPSPHLTTVVLTVSASSTMSPIWTRSTT